MTTTTAMRNPSAADVAAAAGAAPAPTTSGDERLVTEFPFVLPRGYVDGEGEVHRAGRMRLATARDEIQPLRDPRVRNHEAYLTVILLSRVITQLGTVDPITPATIEGLFAADLGFLQDLYRRINQEGHTQAAVSCPSCDHDFVVDVAGDVPGGS